MHGSPIELENAFVRLFPLRHASIDALHAAAATIGTWTLSLAPFGATREGIATYAARAAADEDAGRALVFAVEERRSGRIVGSTRLTDVERTHRRVELGYTWYAPEVWGGPVNPACKLLLLRHAFEAMGMERVYFYVNLRNERSLRAVERLGAVREGLLRHDRLLPDGTWRDTVVLSILRDEWPDVRERLASRLGLFEV